MADGSGLRAWSPVRSDEPKTGVPIAAAKRALAHAGLTPAQVDLVAVAGGFAPVFPRRRPMIERLLTGPLARAIDVNARLQATLRSSGVSAFQADAVGAQLHNQLKEEGFGQRRTTTMNMHRALAEAAYRLQPADEAVVIVLDPASDGSALSVHVGRAGQLDRQHVASGVESLHTHLWRAASALGVPVGGPSTPIQRLVALADGAEPDAAATAAARERLHAVDGRLSHGVSARADTAMMASLRGLPASVGAASVVANLVEAVADVISWHTQAHGVAHASLAGTMFSDPRFNGLIAARLSLARLTILPGAAGELLPFGAAASEAGLAPHLADTRIGPDVDEGRVDAALTAAGWRANLGGGLIALMERGGAVGRYRGRLGPDPLAFGARCVLFKPNDPGAEAAARAALRLPSTARTRLLVRANGACSWPDRERGELCTPVATLAVPVDGVLTELQEVSAASNLGLHRLLVAAEARGWPGLAALPFSEADGGPPDGEGHAFEIWRRSGIGALQLGAKVLERPA